MFNKGKDRIMSIDQFVDDESSTVSNKEKYIISGLENKIAERDKVIRQLNQQVEQLTTALRKTAFTTAVNLGKDKLEEIEYFNVIHNRGNYVLL